MELKLCACEELRRVESTPCSWKSVWNIFKHKPHLHAQNVNAVVWKADHFSFLQLCCRLCCDCGNKIMSSLSHCGFYLCSLTHLLSWPPNFQLSSCSDIPAEVSARALLVPLLTSLYCLLFFFLSRRIPPPHLPAAPGRLACRASGLCKTE